MAVLTPKLETVVSDDSVDAEKKPAAEAKSPGRLVADHRRLMWHYAKNNHPFVPLNNYEKEQVSTKSLASIISPGVVSPSLKKALDAIQEEPADETKKP